MCEIFNELTVAVLETELYERQQVKEAARLQDSLARFLKQVGENR